jgi:hypothetical protein
MITNGDFSQGFTGWQWLLQGGQAVYGITSTGELQFNITNGGTQVWEVQATYPGIQLVNGEKYLFEFDAWSDGNRAIEAEVRKNGDPYTNHSKKGLTALTRNRKHFTHEFIMKEPSEPQARIVINVGTSNLNVFVDNVSLKRLAPTGVETRLEKPEVFRLHANYPNPFNASTTITYELPAKTHLDLQIFNVAGQAVRQLFQGEAGSGTHTLIWDGRDDAGESLPSGVYWYRLTAPSGSETKKLLLLR